MLTLMYALCFSFVFYFNSSSSEPRLGYASVILPPMHQKMIAKTKNPNKPYGSPVMALAIPRPKDALPIHLNNIPTKCADVKYPMINVRPTIAKINI